GWRSRQTRRRTISPNRLKPPGTRLARHLHSEVFGRHSQTVGTMRAIHINACLFDLARTVAEVENKLAGALFAGHALAHKLAIDAQFTAAVRAPDVISPQ